MSAAQSARKAWILPSVAAVVVVAIVGGGFALLRSGAQLPLLPLLTGSSGATAGIEADPRFSVLVLPFTNQSDDPDQAYLSDTLTDDIVAEIARIEGSFVVARESAFSFRGRPTDPLHAGRELGVRYVIEGGVWRTGDLLRVSAFLSDADARLDVWGERYQFVIDLLPQLPDTIATGLAKALNAKLAKLEGGQPKPRGLSRVDELIMRARAEGLSGGATRDSLRKAREYLEQALREEPQSTTAQTWLARALALSLASGWSDAAAADTSRVEALFDGLQKSGAKSAVLYAARGLLRRAQARLDDAAKEFEAALTLDRSEPVARAQLGAILLELGRAKEAVPHLEAAVRQNMGDPQVAMRMALLGHAQAMNGNVDQALFRLKRAHDLEGRQWSVPFTLAAALGMRGEVDAGKAALAEARRRNPALTSIAAAQRLDPTYSNPKYLELRETTLNAGLRTLGFPDR